VVPNLLTLGCEYGAMAGLLHSARMDAGVFQHGGYNQLCSPLHI
jgi:hypothetical protein